MLHRHKRDEPPLETPGSVIGSISLGVAPLPFLAVYSVLFIIHGMFYPVQPPDITSSQTGEAVAGWIAFALLCYGVLTIWWFLSGTRRWPFLLGQLAALGTAIDFVLDSTTGSPAVPALIVVTAGTAVVLALLPASWAYLRAAPPRLPRRRRARPAQRTAPAEVSGEVSGAERVLEGSDLPR